ncbi:Nn.00g039340.m01.CDS01 [Neocucurbitaria sp. VM-36]
MVDVANLEKLRPCGRWETYSTARHHLGFYKNVGLTATYTSSTTFKSPLEELVFRALREVIASHPNLSAITINEEKSYPDVYFARLPEIDLRTCVEFQERGNPFPGDGDVDEELDGLLAEQHSRDFKDEFGRNPFWRLIVVTSADMPNTISVTWFFHHVLADGTSAFLFHDSFIAALNSVVASEAEADPIVKSSTTALLPSLEELHALPISWSFLLHAVLGLVLPSIFNKRPAKLWTGNPVPTNVAQAPKLNYRTHVVSAKSTRKLAQASRDEKTSVTATLQCLLAASLFAGLPATEWEKIKIESPISMRRFLKGLPENQMTNAITQYGVLHQRPTTTVPHEAAEADALRYFSWDEARAVKSTIQAEVAKEGRENPIALLKYVSDMPQLFIEKLGKPRHPSSEFSNIGVYKAKEAEGEGPWKLGRMTFSQSPNLTSCPFCVNVVTGADENAVLNFCWTEGAVEEEVMVRVIYGIAKGIDALIARIENL